MNVVHIFPYPAGVPGGHSNAIRSFIECQRANAINAVGVAPRAGATTGELGWGDTIAEVDGLFDLRWASLARQFAIEPDNSLVNFHSVNRGFGSMLADLRLAGVPYVLTSHGQLGFQTAWHWLQKFIYLQFVNRGPGRAAGLQVLTRLAARRARCLLPTFQGELLVQGNLVRVPDLANVPAASRSEYGIPAKTFVLLFLGRLDVRVKGLDLVIKAFSRLPSDRTRLVLAGPDWEGGRAELEGMARDLGCRDRVHFPGPAYDDRKWSLLQMADVFVSPSRREAFNIAQAEAMALGLPVITSTNVSLAEDLQAAQAALVVPPGVESLANGMARLEADGAQRRELGKRGKNWVVTHCEPRAAGSRFLAFYHSILEGRRSGAN